MDTIRRRVLWVLVGIAATTVAVIAWTTMPAWPVVGVAVATLVVAVNTITSRLKHDVCLACGADMRNVAASAYGSVCPCCGQVHEGSRMALSTDQPNPEKLDEA
jgi:ribosomal protein L32